MASRRFRVRRRNLRAGAKAVGVSSAAVDGRAPRLGPGEYLGGNRGGVGRFEGRDPLQTGKVGSRWQWLAVAGWAAMIGGALSAARRRGQSN